MKRSLFFLAALASSAFAELPQMSDKTEWLGYFVGWEEKEFDFGIGADGEPIMHPKKSGKRASHKELTMRYLVQEQIKGKWVTRSFLKDEGLASEAAKGLDPKKPVSIVTTHTGGTKVEWMHAISGGLVMLKPKVVEKTTENPVRVGFSISMPRLYRIEGELDKRELKDKVGSDVLSGVRVKDGKKVRVKFSDVDDDITSEEFLAEGASAIEVKSKAFNGGDLVMELKDEKGGIIEVEPKGPLYNPFKLTWWPDPAKVGEKDCVLSFGME